MDSPRTLPATYYAASEGSRLGQRRFLTTTRIRLVALFLAAVGGAASWTAGSFDLLGWLALLAFTTALATEFYQLTTDPVHLWYEARAATESTKTVTWRYLVGGDPFPAGMDPHRADEQFLSRLHDILEGLASVALPPIDDSDEQITPYMRERRATSFEERRELYLTDRITSQARWYGREARRHDRMARACTAAAVALEFAGVIGATLKAFGRFDIDLLGMLGAGAAGVMAWSQARQYAYNSRAYSVAYQELAAIRSELRAVPEADWARYVQDAEEAISREHTLWRASKGLSPRR
ncbi:DUF4231 domain-containing protein [Actinoplanes sp. NPDC051851]|uniref:DUF4231 domain-containing protein n=1 Tax=Actinoplanes sp. NPDC051851 TaxID=3154753 RepID=UPI003438A805